MPADLVMKAMNVVHRALIRVAPRRFGHEALGMPVLELTTTGRLSGRPRSVMLTSPVRDGDAIVVVASRGGDDRHPDWLLNLRAEPNVEVALRNGPRRPMTAHVADAAGARAAVEGDHRVASAVRRLPASYLARDPGGAPAPAG